MVEARWNGMRRLAYLSVAAVGAEPVTTWAYIGPGPGGGGLPGSGGAGVLVVVLAAVVGLCVVSGALAVCYAVGARFAPWLRRRGRAGAADAGGSARTAPHA